jgi:hypothetical protein
MFYVMLVPMLHLMYFYIKDFHSMNAVHVWLFSAVSICRAFKLLLLLSSSSSSSSLLSPLCRVFILIFLRQSMSLGNTEL